MEHYCICQKIFQTFQFEIGLKDLSEMTDRGQLLLTTTKGQPRSTASDLSLWHVFQNVIFLEILESVQIKPIWRVHN